MLNSKLRETLIWLLENRDMEISKRKLLAYQKFALTEEEKKYLDTILTPEELPASKVGGIRYSACTL